MAGTIASLIDALNKAPDYSVETLERIVQQELPSDEEIAAVADVVQPYGRTILELNDDYEVIIGCWPLGGWCDPHDHGDSEGVVVCYSGEIEHFDYRLEGDTLELYHQATIKDKESMRLPLGMIHALQNISSEKPYIGLHLYSPPTRDVRVFDTNSGDIYHITDDAASIVPTDERCIKHVERGAFTFRNLVHERTKQTEPA